MSLSPATSRYVKALFEAAVSRGETERVAAELARFGALVAGAPELGAALRNPRLQAAAKRRILLAAGLESAADLLQDFAGLCLERGRPEVVLEAPAEFGRLHRAARGVAVVRAESAVPLDASSRAALLARLEELTGLAIELHEAVDAALLGGVRVFIGSRMYDGSLRRRLADLASHLESVRIP